MKDIINNIKDVYKYNKFDKKFENLISAFGAKFYDECANICGFILCGICKAASMISDDVYSPYIFNDSKLAPVYDAFGTYLDKRFNKRLKTLLLDEVIITGHIRPEDDNEEYVDAIFQFVNDVAEELNHIFSVHNFDIFKINIMKKSYTENNKASTSSKTSNNKFYNGSGKNNDGCISATATLVRGLGLVDKGIIFKKKLFNLKLDLTISNPDNYKIKSIKLIISFTDKTMGDMVFDLEKQVKVVKDINLPFNEFKKGIKAFVEIDYKLDLLRSKKLHVNL